MIATPAVEPLSYDDARLCLGYTVYEQTMIMDEMLRRFSAPPFTAQAGQAARVATWRERAAAAERMLQRPGSREALEALYEKAISLAPDDWVLQRNCGWALASLGAPDRAIPHLERAHTLIDNDDDTLFALGKALTETGRAAEAARYFSALRRIEPGYPGLPDPPAPSQ